MDCSLDWFGGAADSEMNSHLHRERERILQATMINNILCMYIYTGILG